MRAACSYGTHLSWLARRAAFHAGSTPVSAPGLSRRLSLVALGLAVPVGMTGKAQGGTGTDVLAADAVNLRDIGEVCPGLQRGRVYRCSQIYSSLVLKELDIKTVIDLRGRAPRRRVHHSAKHRRADAEATAEAAAAAAAATPEFSSKTESVTHSGGSAGMVALHPRMNDSSGADDNGRGNGNGGGSDAASEGEGPVPAASPAGLPADPASPLTQHFSLIPEREFAMQMLRMPSSVWGHAFVRLVTLRDPRAPFVRAFANEQYLGFTRYYTMIMEHCRPNVAAVLRVFTKRDNLPALVHCAHGKDRTGVIVMLLLLLAGATHDQVASDYVQSELALRRYRAALGVSPVRAGIPLDDMIIASTEETIRAVLTYLVDRYGTVDEYLATCGLTPDELRSIRETLTA